MAITRVSVGAQGESVTSGAAITGAYQGGFTALADDFCVGICVGKPTADTTSVPTAPSGYTQQATRRRAGQPICIVAWTKKLTAGEAAPQITVPAVDSWTNLTTFQTAVYRGVDATNPMDVAAVASDAAAATTFAPTGLTTATDKAWVLSMVGTPDDNALALSVGSEQGFTAQMSGANYDTITGTDLAMGLADKEVATAGAVTCPTWNETVLGTDPWVAITLALRQAAVLKALPATAVGVAAMSVVTIRAVAMPATAVGVAGLSKKMFQTLPGVAVGVAVLNKKMFRTLAVTAVGVAAIARSTTYVKALAATAVGVATLTKKMFVTMTATAVGVPAMTRKMFKTLAVAAVGVPSLAAALLTKVTMSTTAIGIAAMVAQFMAGVAGVVYKLKEKSHNRRRR